MPGSAAAAPVGTHLVIMGPAGCGKSSVAGALARRLALPLAEGDDFHSDRAREKMAAGVPLTDEDRFPWLSRLADWMTAQAATGSVVSCSALRHDYRELLRTAQGEVAFVRLDLAREELQARLEARTDHFMPASLLDSQLEALEPLRDGEGITVDGSRPIAVLVDTIVSQVADVPASGHQSGGTEAAPVGC